MLRTAMSYRSAGKTLLNTAICAPSATSAAVSGRRGHAISATNNLVNLSVNDKTGIATLTLNRPPVNSLNHALLADISSALDDVAKNRSKGLILTSVSGNRGSVDVTWGMEMGGRCHSCVLNSILFFALTILSCGRQEIRHSCGIARANCQQHASYFP